MYRYTPRHMAINLLAIGLLTCSSLSLADPVSSTEAGKRTMSKFMINLAKFITWPDSSFDGDTSPVKYCILGPETMGSALDTAMSGKNAKGRPFEVSRMGLGDTGAAKACHVVFISVTNTDELIPVIDALQGLPVLTVGEIEQFAQYGGMVGFYGKGRKVALAINKKRLEGAGLSASSKLYRASTM